MYTAAVIYSEQEEMMITCDGRGRPFWHGRPFWREIYSFEIHLWLNVSISATLTLKVQRETSLMESSNIIINDKIWIKISLFHPQSKETIGCDIFEYLFITFDV